MQPLALRLPGGRLRAEHDRREQDRDADQAGRDEERELVAAGERRRERVALRA